VSEAIVFCVLDEKYSLDVWCVLFGEYVLGCCCVGG
jgi:hypothetical protein